MIVLTIGTFDTLHVGHLELLTECRKIAGWDGRVVAGLNRDGFVERYKARPPVQNYAAREEMLRACRLVDLVVANIGDEDARPIIEAVRPDRLAIGTDWLDPGHDESRYLAQLGVTPDWMDARRLTVEYIPRTRGVSSSALRMSDADHAAVRRLDPRRSKDDAGHYRLAL